ncbi:MAG TPA: class IV adenylate cyclase [Candidatus Sulfotelmatobacter sp.]|nr:class IV adenylate cyclase [Candidatus Sulfotelmatobacter sp.]
MAREIEIKLLVQDVAALRRKLRRVGARKAARGSGRVHEWNTLYDTAAADLRGRDELLRVRVETPTGSAGSKRIARFVLTFKGPVKGNTETGSAKQSANDRRFGGNHKVREEIELEVGDAKALGTIFAGLGMRESFHYEKYRTTFRMPDSARWARGLLIELDETPIGIFVELEGPAAAIDRVAKLLGYSKDEYVLTNYLRLHAERCIERGEKVGDMVFRKR